MVVDDLCFGYEGGERVFSSFSLSLGDGEHVLVLAPPGSGKTTLAKILTGPVPAYSGGSLSGSISMDGRNLLDIPIAERMEKVSRISQDTDEMLLFSTVEEEVRFPLANMGLGWDEVERRTEESLCRFSLSALRKSSSSQLSGGEKRRLMLAVLFAIDPEVYVFDESFDELSPAWRERLAAMIRSLGRKVIAFGSHELDEYSGAFDRIVTIADGRCVPYAMQPMPELDALPVPGSHVLAADGLRISRRHTGMKDEVPFSLSVGGFTLRSGTCVTLLGENGSGKSTFAKVLCGLLREDGGTVSIDGAPIGWKDRRHKVAYLMQNPYQELFLPTVRDELKSTGCSDEAMAAAASSFQLPLDGYVAELSYGKAKLLQAALFLLLGRRFAIFDELDSALDYRDSLKAVEAYLAGGAGLLVITHDRKFASRLPGDKLRMDGGRIVGY